MKFCKICNIGILVNFKHFVEKCEFFPNISHSEISRASNL